MHSYENIYAIVRDKDSKQLKYISVPSYYDKEPSRKELCGPFGYAVSFSCDHCSYIPYENVINRQYVSDSRYQAFAFKQSVNRLFKEYDVVAYSHRKGGWRAFNWAYNDDITFTIQTNFGYGRSSFFEVIYRYKGVQLCPYADYVKYRESTVGSILSNTKSYMLLYSEWNELLMSTLDFYNAVVKKQSSYIINWVQDNIKEMVRILRSFVYYSSNSFYAYNIKNNMKISSFATVTDDDFWILKSAKIANSLDFIENFKILPVEFGATEYIQPIKDICKELLPKLKVRIDEISTELEELNKSYSRIVNKEIYLLYKKLNDKYKYRNGIYCKSDFRIALFFLRGLRRLHIKYDIKEIRSKLKILEDLIEKESELKSKINRREQVFSSLKGSELKIENYFESADE